MYLSPSREEDRDSLVDQQPSWNPSVSSQPFEADNLVLILLSRNLRFKDKGDQAHYLLRDEPGI